MKLPHAQIHLPPLDAGYALTLVAILERAIDAIWRAHGHGMAELQTLRAEAQRASQPRRPRKAANPDDHLF